MILSVLFILWQSIIYSVALSTGYWIVSSVVEVVENVEDNEVKSFEGLPWQLRSFASPVQSHF